jgi:atypical dual specificity phosphatase
LFLRKLRAGVADQPTGFVWVEDGRLAASGYPASKKQIEWIGAQGIDVVLTLTEKGLPGGLIDGIPIEFKHISMRDHEAPSVKVLGEGAALVENRLSTGKKVLVHCLAGEGRTGCVLAAFLIKYRGLGAEVALRTLREIKPAFVERSQEESVYSFNRAAKVG